VPLLVGTDGQKKMSQSVGNYISVRDDPGEMFGKTMSIPDDAMAQWFLLAAGLAAREVEQIERGLADGSLHPGETKRRLARAVVGTYWGSDHAHAAEAEFDRIFRAHDVPDDVASHRLSEDAEIWIPGLLAEAGMVASNSEGRRMLRQGAVKLDGTKVESETVPREDLEGVVVQVGKRRFVRLVG